MLKCTFKKFCPLMGIRMTALEYFCASLHANQRLTDRQTDKETECINTYNTLKSKEITF